MQVDSKGIALIEGFEGLRLVAYLLPGEKYWTVGYGHSGPDVTPHMIITVAQAVAFLQADLKWAEYDVNTLVKVLLNQNQYDALVSFVYNVGTGNFKLSSVLGFTNRQLFSQVPARMLLWAEDSTHKISQGLLNRRKAEGVLFSEKVAT